MKHPFYTLNAIRYPLIRMRTLLLTAREIERLIDVKTAIRVVRQAFIAQARGQAVMPPKVYLNLPGGNDFRAMPAYVAHPAACGLKWVNVHPGNPAKGLPTVMAVIVLNDPATGVPLAVMDGLHITGLRTAAAAGVAAKAMARPGSSRVGLVGCGAQALYELHALQALFRLQQVRVWGYRAGEAAYFCRRMQRFVKARLVPAATVRECVADADIVTTITTSHRPLVTREWIRPGTHFNAIGADAPGKQELDPHILREARVIVDDRTQAMHGGELNVPLARKQISPRLIRGTIGELLLGRIKGRTNAAEITVFDSTGLATHDIALAHAAYRLALRRHLGHSVQLC